MQFRWSGASGFVKTDPNRGSRGSEKEGTRLLCRSKWSGCEEPGVSPSVQVWAAVPPFFSGGLSSSFVDATLGLLRLFRGRRSGKEARSGLYCCNISVLG
jgi:hypothetical protein